MCVDVLVKLKDYVPVFNSLVWIVFSIIIICAFRSQITNLFRVIRQRVEKGSSIKAGPIEIGAQLNELPYMKQVARATKDEADIPREVERKRIYADQKGIFLTHIIKPTNKKGLKYDIFIYLIRHKDDNFSDIDKVEFFFGHKWGNEIYTEYMKNGIFGISTSAYAPFLCTCKITFNDKSTIMLNRYIDFEMEQLLPQP